jgi:ATP phosphoribosyltransferase regulatory subunit
LDSSSTERWLLPEGIDEMLPDQAHLLEQLRRKIYDLHLGWGYKPVAPPFVEYLESLLSTAGAEFDRQTFKIVDPLSGRMMGLRADMTPQVARVDAHRLGNEGINRLFYLGTVVRSYGDTAAGGRSPLQLGAELFGHSGSASDIEVIRLMLATLDGVGVRNVHLDLGDAEIFRTLCARIGLTKPDQEALFALLQSKAQADVNSFAVAQGLSARDTAVLTDLCMLHGDASVLDRAREILGPYGDSMLDTIARLGHVGDALAGVPDCTVHFDLAELRGYQYHNGVVFAAYVSDVGVEIARGGRYDGIGGAFGRNRPATGYSTDLKNLMRIVGANEKVLPKSILAPPVNDPALDEKVAELRQQGEIVITDLGNQSSVDCDRQLIQHNDKWLLESR